MKTRFLEAVALLVGATIGAGILGIPYVTAKAGFWTGILVIIALGTATLILNLYMGEIALRTKGKHQFTGYAERYTGKPGRHAAAAFMIIGIYGALIAYLIGVSDSAAAILKGNPIYYGLIFIAIGAMVVWKGIKSLGRTELAIATILIIVVLLIPAISADRIKTSNMQGFSPYLLMVPYGVVLFAFIGSPAIPAVKEELERNKEKVKNAIVIGTAIPIAVYLLFATVVVGIIGDGFEALPENERIATIALGNFLGQPLGGIANLLAILTMSTSFLALGFALWVTYQYDCKMKKLPAFLLTFSVPLAVFVIDQSLADITSFLNILGIVGAVTGGIAGILIVIMHYRAKRRGDRKPEYSIKANTITAAILIAVFAAGIINELITFFF